MFKNKIVITLIVVLLVIVSIFFISKPVNESQEAEETTNTNVNKSSKSLSDAHAIAVDISDPDRLYIANHSGLSLLDSDGELVSIGSSNDDFMSFALHPTDSEVMFTSGHPKTGGNIGFQKTNDAGESWMKISDGLNGPVDFHTLAVDQVNPSNIYGYYAGQLQKSEDEGSTWSYVDDIPTGIIQLVTSSKQDSLYASTTDGLYFSEDQGLSWAKVSGISGVVTTIAENPSNPNEMIVYSRSGGLQKTANQGESWQDITSFNSEQVYFLSYSKTNPETIYALTESLDVYRSDDGADSWRQYNK